MISLTKTLFSFLLIASSLFAGTTDPLTNDEKYVEYGKKFEYVLSICGLYEDNRLFCGSAVIIDQEWILTAAHVVKGAKHCGVHVKDSTVILMDEIILHKDFNGSFGLADIALCHLVEPLELDFYPPLYETDDEVGKICCISGYGLTGTFLEGQKISDGKKRAGSNIIDSISGDLLICTPNGTIQEGRTELEFMIASGDSGGGLFIDGKLAGINSCVMAEGKAPKSMYGDEAGHTRVSKYVGWIKEIIEKRKKKIDK
jgi:hypothetical protein